MALENVMNCPREGQTYLVAGPDTLILDENRVPQVKLTNSKLTGEALPGLSVPVRGKAPAQVDVIISPGNRRKEMHIESRILRKLIPNIRLIFAKYRASTRRE